MKTLPESKTPTQANTNFDSSISRFAAIALTLALTSMGTSVLADHHTLDDACRQPDKVDVVDQAYYVIYYNNQNFPVQIEDLAGEKNRRICQMDPAGSTCPPGYCQITILGVNYCKKC